jgi:hypothetical protein
MKRAIILGVLTLTLHCAAFAAAFAEEARTAQDLYGLCTRNEPSCGSYLAGVAAVMVIVGRTYRQRRLDGPFAVLSICPNGEPITGVTLSKIFTAWFDAHADRERDPMEHAAIEALLNKWPCARKIS